MQEMPVIGNSVLQLRGLQCMSQVEPDFVRLRDFNAAEILGSSAAIMVTISCEAHYVPIFLLVVGCRVECCPEGAVWLLTVELQPENQGHWLSWQRWSHSRLLLSCVVIGRIEEVA